MGILISFYVSEKSFGAFAIISALLWLLLVLQVPIIFFRFRPMPLLACFTALRYGRGNNIVSFEEEEEALPCYDHWGDGCGGNPSKGVCLLMISHVISHAKTINITLFGVVSFFA